MPEETVGTLVLKGHRNFYYHFTTLFPQAFGQVHSNVVSSAPQELKAAQRCGLHGQKVERIA